MGRMGLFLIFLTGCSIIGDFGEESTNAGGLGLPGSRDKAPRPVFLSSYKDFPDALSWDSRIQANMNLLGLNRQPAGRDNPPARGKVLFRPLALHPNRASENGVGRLSIQSLGEEHGAYLKNTDGTPFEFGPDMIKTLLNNQMALSMDPTIDPAENPAPCQLPGSTFQNGECYRGVLYLTLSPDDLPSGGSRHHVHAARVYVRVQAFDTEGVRSDEPRVIDAVLHSNIVPLHTASGERVLGAELSATADGRFMFARSAQYNFFENAENFYQWNQNWSNPIDYFRIHEATRGVSFRGRAFEDHYPIAKAPITNLLGQPCDQTRCESNYPWISQGGEDLFLQQTMDARDFGAIRGSYTFFGATTRHQMVVVDNPFNENRVGGAGRTNGPGMYPGMWTRFDEWKPNSGIMPQHKDERVYLTTASIGGKLAEVSLREHLDDNYLFYLRMNEVVRRRHVGETRNDELNEDNTENRRILSWLAADTSGHRNNAFLNGGARFTPDVTTRRELLVGDTPGFSGRAVYFPYGGSLNIARNPSSHTNPAGDDALHAELPFATWQFAIKLLFSPVENVGVFRKGQDYRMFLTPSGEITFAGQSLVNETRTPFFWRTGVMVDADKRWAHVSMRVRRRGADNLRLDVYLHGENGEQHATTEIAGQRIAGSRSDLNIGPPSIAQPNPGTGMIYALDEFAISNVARPVEQMTRVARYRGRHSTSTVGIEQDFASLDGSQAGIQLTVDDLPTLMKTRLQAAGAGHNAAFLKIPYNIAHDLLFHQRGTGAADEYVNLGRKIFNDTDLTGIGIGCVSCHAPERGFVDLTSEATSVGAEGPLTRNTPTLLNRAYSQEQFLDSRNANLVHQAWAPILNPKEMAGTEANVLSYFRSQAPYRADFSRVGVDLATVTDSALRYHVAMALSTFQITLLSSPLSDQPLPPSIEEQVVRGRGLFFGKAQCANCHLGPNLTDEMLHNTGTAGLNAESCTQTRDWGRFETSRSMGDAGKFKTPSLRFVAGTGPYFHHGCVNTLVEVVQHYNRGGRPDAAGKIATDVRPLGLSDSEMLDLVRFLQRI